MLLLVALGVVWIGLGGVLQAFEVRGIRGSRLDLWRDMLPMVPHFPVFGVGWNAFATAYPWYQTIWKTEWIGEAHNDYLQALLDGGVVGLALVCGLLGARPALGARAGPPLAGRTRPAWALCWAWRSTSSSTSTARSPRTPRPGSPSPRWRSSPRP